MGAFISTPVVSTPRVANVPCTTSTSSVHSTTSTSTSVKFTSTSVPTTSSSIPVTTSTSTSSAATSFPTFYLKSSCDYSCLGHYADDDQIYSNLYSSNTTNFDTFYLNGTQLYDASTGTLCVASEAGGSGHQLQCSNDLDYINGVALVGGFSQSGNVLTYSGTTTFYGCGVVDITDHYEPDGLTYITSGGDPSNCQVCTFSLVAESACDVQDLASSISTTYLAPLTTTSAAATTSTSAAVTTTSSSSLHTTTSKPCTTSTTTTSKPCTTSTTTTSAAAATTPKSCGTGYCKVQWLQQADCYWQNCANCPWGTKCQQYQFWPLPAASACLPIL